MLGGGSLAQGASEVVLSPQLGITPEAFAATWNELAALIMHVLYCTNEAAAMARTRTISNR